MSDLTNKTLFLGDVSSFVTEAELEELFSQQGEVTEVKISGASRGISLCYGFVTMAERTQAEEAMEKLQGVVLGGRPIRINWAARNVRDKNSYSAMNDMINSVHVRYRTLQVRMTFLSALLCLSYVTSGLSYLTLLLCTPSLTPTPTLNLCAENGHTVHWGKSDPIIREVWQSSRCLDKEFICRSGENKTN